MWVTVSSRHKEPWTVEVSPSVLVIGRAPDSHLVIDDPRVSSRHARVELQERGAWVSDLHSTNGTLVDGRRLQGPVWIEAPGEFVVGETTVRLSLHRRTAGPVPAPAPQPTQAFSLRPQQWPATPSQPHVAHAGPVAGGNVSIGAGRDAAGRDIIHEGFKLQTRMRSSAKACIRLGIVASLVGFALFGYFVLSWNSRIFSAVTDPSMEPPVDLPSPLPWLPLGAGLMFLGMALVVTGLLIPRDRIISPRGD